MATAPTPTASTPLQAHRSILFSFTHTQKQITKLTMRAKLMEAFCFVGRVRGATKSRLAREFSQDFFYQLAALFRAIVFHSNTKTKLNDWLRAFPIQYEFVLENKTGPSCFSFIFRPAPSGLILFFLLYGRRHRHITTTLSGTAHLGRQKIARKNYHNISERYVVCDHQIVFGKMRAFSAETTKISTLPGRKV